MKTRFVLVVVFLLAVAVGSAEAKNKPKTLAFHPNSEGFITTWLVRGPFPLRTLEDRTVDFLAKQGGETKVYTFKTIGPISVDSLQKSNNAVWQLFLSATYRIDFKSIFSPGDRVAAYAAGWLKSPQKQRVLLKVGSDDGVRIWLNGKLVHDNPAQRGMQRDNDVVPVTLHKGINFLLVKIDQGGGDWRFCLRFTDMKDRPLKNLQIVIPGNLPSKRVLSIDAQSIRVATVLVPKGQQRVWEVTLRSDAEMPLGPEKIPVKVILETEQGKPVATLFDLSLNMRKKSVLHKEFLPRKLVDVKKYGVKNNMLFVRLNVYSPNGKRISTDSRPVFFY